MIINGDQSLPVPANWNFGKFILHHFKLANKPHAVCLENCNTGEQLSYKEFTQYSVSLSVALSKLGVTKGDVVAVGSEKRIAFLPTTLAVVFTGAAFMPFDLRIGRAVLRHQLNLARPEYFICSNLFWTEYSDILKSCSFIKTFICFEEINEIELSIQNLISRPTDVETFETADVEGQTDTALILYSSGTTGMPKGVLITHLSCVLSSSPEKFQDESLETAMSYGEWYHRYDIFTTYAILCAGKKVVFAENLPESFLKNIQDFKVNCAIIVPSIINYLAKEEEVDKYDLSSLKEILSSGSSLHLNLIEAVKKRISTIKNVTQVYGMTEAGIMTSEHWGTKGVKAGSVGMACPGISLKIVDPETRLILGPNQPGEICARGPLLMKGYIGVESSTYLDQQGFFSTGDLGYFDEDLYLYITGRLKDELSFDGYKVSPLALETILLAHPGVREAAVVGKPAGEFGEEPTAFVVRQPGAAVTEQELVDYVALEVSPYMQLRGGVKFVPELPKNKIGKIIRRQLREMI